LASGRLQTKFGIIALYIAMAYKEQYDVLIAGAGASGLSLAYYLTQSADFSGSILIIDKERKTKNDRTWCFWGDIDPAFEHLKKKSWCHLSYCDEGGVVKRPVRNLGYHMIQGLDYYNFMYEVLEPLPNVDFYYGEIERYEDQGDRVITYVDAERAFFRSKWLANSALLSKPENDGFHYQMLQHFQGYFIETEKPKFDVDNAYLMDFRNDQSKHLNFFYVLPMSEREALVEYTVFSGSLEKNSYYEKNLDRYIREKLQISDYKVKERERGAIPMTDRPFERQSSSRVINMGTAGGAVKPTTGYAFVRILQQSREISEILTGKVLRLRKQPYNRFRFYDQLLLWILTDYGNTGIGRYIFSRLFRKNDMERILTFLCEKSKISDDVRIFATLPIVPFLKAIAGNVPKWYALHKARLFGSGSLKSQPSVSQQQEVATTATGSTY
jgi:lycopene beta-cyclase